MVLVKIGRDLNITEDFCARLKKELYLVEKRIPKNSDLRIHFRVKHDVFSAHFIGNIYYHRVCIRRSAKTLKEAYIEGRDCLFRIVERHKNRVLAVNHQVTA